MWEEITYWTFYFSSEYSLLPRFSGKEVNSDLIPLHSTEIISSHCWDTLNLLIVYKNPFSKRLLWKLSRLCNLQHRYQYIPPFPGKQTISKQVLWKNSALSALSQVKSFKASPVAINMRYKFMQFWRFQHIKGKAQVFCRVQLNVSVPNSNVLLSAGYCHSRVKYSKRSTAFC